MLQLLAVKSGNVWKASGRLIAINIVNILLTAMLMLLFIIIFFVFGGSSYLDDGRFWTGCRYLSVCVYRRLFLIWIRYSITSAKRLNGMEKRENIFNRLHWRHSEHSLFIRRPFL